MIFCHVRKIVSRKFPQKSQKTKIIKAKLKKNDYTNSGFSLLNYVLTISKVFGTSDHLEVLFSKCPKNIVGPLYDIKYSLYKLLANRFTCAIDRTLTCTYTNIHISIS